MQKRWSIVCAVLMGVSLAAGCAVRGDAEVTWRFAIEENPGSVQDAYAQRFAQLIEEHSHGRIDVIVYPYGALGTSDQTTEQLHDDTLQFVMASPGHLGKMIPEVQVFLLHFLLSGDADVDSRALADPELHALFEPLYREKNFALLTFFTEGEMVWTTKDEVHKPADFAGLKFRVMTSPLLIAAYQAYGADPTPLPYAEVYSGLQLNMIDGQVNPVFAIQEMSFYEVTDLMTFPGHAEFVTSVMTNASFYDGLSDDDRKLIDDAVDELQPFILDTQKRFNKERLDIILKKKPGMKIVRLTDEERATFRAKSMPVRDTYVAEAGGKAAAVLNRLLAAVAAAKAEVQQQ